MWIIATFGLYSPMNFCKIYFLKKFKHITMGIRPPDFNDKGVAFANWERTTARRAAYEASEWPHW